MFSFNAVAVSSSSHYLDSSLQRISQASAQGESGGSITMGNINLGGGVSISTAVNLSSASSTTTAVSISHSDVTSANLSSVLDKLSGLRAESGGDLSTLGFASDYLTNMSTGLEAAHGRIMAVDLAKESANYAKLSMQYEAAAVAQAIVAMSAVLDLLLSSVRDD